MMKEILNGGPISCSISITSEFNNYNGGVFKDETNATEHNHSINVVGWGVDETG